MEESILEPKKFFLSRILSIQNTELLRLTESKPYLGYYRESDYLKEFALLVDLP